MVHMFICWIYNLPISCQLASIVYIYVIFSHVHMFPLLVITPIVLDYNVTSQDPYLLCCTFYMYLLGICIRPKVEAAYVYPWFHVHVYLVFDIS